MMTRISDTVRSLAEDSGRGVDITSAEIDQIVDLITDNLDADSTEIAHIVDLAQQISRSNDWHDCAIVVQDEKGRLHLCVGWEEGLYQLGMEAEEVAQALDLANAIVEARPDVEWRQKYAKLLSDCFYFPGFTIERWNCAINENGEVVAVQ